MVSFKSASKDLCDVVAEVARHLASQQVDAAGLMPLLNNQLITLDKNPGVRPVGIGEVLRRIIGKSLMSVLKRDMTRAAGYLKSVLATHLDVKLPYTPCVRFLHRSRATDRCGQRILPYESCGGPSQHPVHLPTSCDNPHKHLPSTVVTGGMELTTEEGTTQGCPLSMAMYALSAVPLMNKCQSVLPTDDLPSASVVCRRFSSRGQPEVAMQILGYPSAARIYTWLLTETIQNLSRCENRIPSSSN